MNLSLDKTVFPVYLRFEQAMTDEELMQFSSENELLRVEREPNGELIVMPPTGTGGGSMELAAGIGLGNWAQADGRGKAFGPNSGFTLPDHSVRAADTAWVSWVRWNALTVEQQEGFAPICPDFVIEVRSKSDRLQPLERKMLQWIENGVEVAWLVDPQRRVVAIYRPGCEIELHHDPSSVQGDGPVRGFELVMARVWG